MRPVAWPARGPATPQPFDPAQQRRARACAGLQTLALGLLALAGLRWALATVRVLRYPFEWSSMDGYYVAYGQRLLSGLPLYSDHATPPMGFEYVPGYLLTLGPLNAIFGPGLWVERLLALCLTAATVAIAGHVVRVRTGSFAWGVIAAALCVAPPVLGKWYLVRGFDVLVLCIGLGATALLAEIRHLNVRWVVCAALLYAGGFYCKQTIVFAWAAGAAIVLVRARALLLPFLGVSVGVGVACGLGLQAWSDGWFWNNAFATTAQNPMYLWLFVGIVLGFVPWVWLVLITAVAAAVWRPREALRHPWVLYWGTGVASMGMAAKLGAAEVYFLPMYVGTIMLACQFAPVYLAAVPFGRWRMGVLAAAAAQALLWLWQPLPVPTAAGERYAERLLDGIRARPGRMLVERADSFATLAGRDVEWEAVQLPILHKIHGMPLDTLLEDLREQRYAVVLYSGQYYSKMYWLRKTIFTYYRPVEGLQALPLTFFYGEEVYTLLEPKPAEELPAAPLLPEPNPPPENGHANMQEVPRNKRVT